MKKILSACLALFLLVSLCMSANAAINSGLLHAYYGYDNSNLIALGVPLRKDGTISIALASESEIPAEVSTVAESEFGTTFYCIIDNAYSMSRTAREREIELLKEISNLMGKHDCLVIAASDEAAVISDPLTSPEARQQAIASISFDGKSTDLYSAIRKGLDQLVSRTDYTFNKCMLVLTDSGDENRTSDTEDTVLQAVNGTTIPVFGVGLLPDYPTDYARRVTNPLQRISEASVGGEFFETSNKGILVREIAATIWDSMQASAVFKVDISSLNRSSLGDTLLLTVQYETEDAIYKDSIDILTSTLPTEKSIPASVTPTVSAAPASVEPGKPLPILLIVGICIAAAAVIAAIAVVVIKRRSEKKSQSIPPVDSFSTTIPAAQANAEYNVHSTVDNSGEAFDGKTVPLPTAADPCIQLQLTAIGHKDQSFAFTLPQNEQRTLGRDNRADIILLIHGEADFKMSGCHCILQWDGSRVFVADCNSTNGTFVNGASVIPGSLQILENGCLLRVGSREYRVNIESAK